MHTAPLEADILSDGDDSRGEFASVLKFEATDHRQIHHLSPIWKVIAHSVPALEGRLCSIK